MTDTNLESAARLLLKKMRVELGHSSIEQYPPRSDRFVDSFIADVLENRELSLPARALLLWAMTRRDGFIVNHSLAKAVGAQPMNFQIVVAELESKGHVKQIKPDRWEFYLFPHVTRNPHRE